MNWFSSKPAEDSQAAQREALSNLLFRLQLHLTLDLSRYQAALTAGQPAVDVLHDLAVDLRAHLDQLRERIHQLELDSRIQQSRIDRLSAENRRLLAEPLRQERDRLQALADQAHTDQAKLAALQNSLIAEQTSRRQEVGNLRSYITAQDQIIARQQLRLNSLLGETPVAETSGGKPG